MASRSHIHILEVMRANEYMAIEIVPRRYTNGYDLVIVHSRPLVAIEPRRYRCTLNGYFPTIRDAKAGAVKMLHKWNEAAKGDTWFRDTRFSPMSVHSNAEWLQHMEIVKY